MKFVTGEVSAAAIELDEIRRISREWKQEDKNVRLKEENGSQDLTECPLKRTGRKVKVHGMIHSIRDMGNLVFLVLRKRDGILQCVYHKELALAEMCGLKECCGVEVVGELRAGEKAPEGMEVIIQDIKVLSAPTEPMPIPVSKWKMSASLEKKLDYRAATLRNLRERAKFKIQEGVVRGFREYLTKEGFTEIHTPKICCKGAEGGANMFRMDYFHRPAVLAQSPQFYKQMMVPVFTRVFETGPVFRAEKHNTKRHLNEYTSLDLEMGFIQGFEDIMEMETGILQYIFRLLESEYSRELAILECRLPSVERIPCVRFDEAKRLVSEKYSRAIRNPYDLEPEEEALIGRYFQEEYGADFVFVTHYPSKKRPFYACDDPEDGMYTLSFDCLFRGMEITTGGKRIHDYRQLADKMEKRGICEEGMECYLSAFRYGMPPHGGLGIGLERITMKLVGEENVRETTLFPRDLGRLEP